MVVIVQFVYFPSFLNSRVARIELKETTLWHQHLYQQQNGLLPKPKTNFTPNPYHLSIKHSSPIFHISWPYHLIIFYIFSLKITHGFHFHSFFWWFLHEKKQLRSPIFGDGDDYLSLKVFLSLTLSSSCICIFLGF